MAITVRKQLTLDEILSRVDELDIYRTYIGDVKVKQMISSPLRSGDSDPSFRIYPSENGRLKYVDYGTAERGNIIDFVSSKFPYLTYGELLERIWRDTNCGVLPPLKQQVRRYKIKSAFPQLLVKKRKPNEKDVLFWNEFGITKETLNWGRVFPISRFWLDDKLYGCRTASYAYDLFTEWKIYRPHEKKLRFISGGMELQGYRLLPEEGDICIIQKSYKDVLLMKEFNIPSFAPQAESIDVPEPKMEDILKRFNRVFIWGDPDDAGNRFIERHVEKYGITPIMNTCDTKDLTDHSKKYGKESARIMTDKLIGR